MSRELWANVDRYFESRLLPADAGLDAAPAAADARELTGHDAFTRKSARGATSLPDSGTHSEYRRGETPPQEQIR